MSYKKKKKNDEFKFDIVRKELFKLIQSLFCIILWKECIYCKMDLNIIWYYFDNH